MSDDPAIPGYTVHRVLGRGNTSVVHLATDQEGRRLALKIPHDHTLRVQEAAERFGNEVRLTLKFRHSHLVKGYAGTPFGPQAFLAMQYYPKGTLNDQLMRLSTQTLPFAHAMRILSDVAAALKYLHSQGAVHQDVKTQNVYLDEEGRAALGDMGSTYFVSQGGQVSGSPYYMAPEIYHGESSSSASDVYSLGVLMYELLIGARPFNGHTYEELMVAHLTRFPVAMSHTNPAVARTVSKVAELALAKRPQDRPSALQIHRELQLAMGLTVTETIDESVRRTHVEPPKRNVGRHGPTTPGGFPERQTAETKPAERGGWNPFKRKK